MRVAFDPAARSELDRVFEWIARARSLRSGHLSAVMPALVAGIHVFLATLSKQDVDGRDKPGHDSGKVGSISGVRVSWKVRVSFSNIRTSSFTKCTRSAMRLLSYRS